jgi:uncharacterized iron-regulated membrane protein
VQGTRTPAQAQRTFARRVHVLHVSLFAGKVGNTIVAIVCVAALLIVLGGIILWFPRPIWRVNWRASWKRIVFDLHHQLGIISALVLIVITASGVLITSDALARWVGRLDAAPMPPPPRMSAPHAAGARPLSLDDEVRRARAALPGASVMFFDVPTGDDDVLSVGMRFPEDRTPGGRSRVWLDQYTGAVLRVASSRAAGPGTRINNLKRSLHTGDVWGKPSEAIWLLATIVMLTQIATGTMMWWNARRARSRRSTRDPQIAAAD